jgi:hypothetical protein
MALPRADRAERFLGGVAQLHHRLDAEEAGAALERVKAAEHRVELVGVLGPVPAFDQLFAEAIDDFLRLDDEVGEVMSSDPRLMLVTQVGSETQARAGRRRRSGKRMAVQISNGRAGQLKPLAGFGRLGMRFEPQRSEASLSGARCRPRGG